MKNNLLVKITLFSFTILLLGSCHVPSYTTSNSISNYGVDFREGKWLMNIIQAPGYSKARLRKIDFLNVFEMF